MNQFDVFRHQFECVRHRPIAAFVRLHGRLHTVWTAATAGEQR
jgi:hypothetical protein